MVASARSAERVSATLRARSSPDAVLRRLRRRLTGLFVLVAGLGVVAFVITLLLLDVRSAQRRLDAELRGQAARAAALMYVERGRAQVEAVRDDDVSRDGVRLVVFAAARGAGEAETGAAPMTVLVRGEVDPARVLPLAVGALSDSQEVGRYDTVAAAGHRYRAVAMPWFDGDRVAGATVALEPLPGAGDSTLIRPAAIGGLALLALLGVAAWAMAGRSLSPAAQALEDRERFLATAAHELRAPLARLRAGAEAARRTIPPDRPEAGALRRLMSTADSAGQVVSNLLLATRIDHVEVPVRVEQVRLDQLAADLERTYDSVVVDVRQAIVVQADPALLRHALTNLVDNAIRHGRVGEDIPTVTVTAFLRGAEAVLQVADDGPGFPPEVDVLARYVSGPRGGTGLGLPLVAWIIQQHGGRLVLGGSTPEHPGAVVEIGLPARKAG